MEPYNRFKPIRRYESIDDLNNRERQLLEMLCRGYTPQQVAAKWFRSPKTVAAIAVSLYEKLGIADHDRNSRADLVAWAAQRGYIAFNFPTSPPEQREALAPAANGPAVSPEGA